jgi:hydroxymethylpyrimidine/phosphomethylpyrimidine kinase
MAVAVALTIAGSDPSGGAGIQADLKTFHQFGVYGEAAITLLTVQNTQRVSQVETMKPELVTSQIRAVLEDIPPAAAKTGALGSPEVVDAVARALAEASFPIIVDPVMISKHGGRLVSPDAEHILKRELVPRAFLLTPNVPEAEVLSGMSIKTVDDMKAAGEKILLLGCQAVLVKGGHLEGEPLDVLCSRDKIQTFGGKRVLTRHTHGTGCTYSAAITAALALGNTLFDAVRLAREYVQLAIETAPQLGSGYGPVNHFAGLNPATR